jgi:glycosyltransferase involved in cell wall biosynthesis
LGVLMIHKNPCMDRQLTFIPRISIIVATWNAANTFERCLRSVVEQSFTDWELLVVDGASTDGTVELITEHRERISWWQSKKDNGIYDAWNQALGHARGEYVTFLGADDTWHAPDTLTKAFDAIGNNHYDLVTGRGALVDTLGLRYHEFGNAWSYKGVMRRMTICHPGALHRRDLFIRFGTFDTSYFISADYDFILRLPANIRVLHLSTVLADIADGGISRSRRWLMLREFYRAQASCPRIGMLRAAFNLIDKVWRIPVARVLGIPN